MRATNLLLILLSVSMSAVAQLLLKLGVQGVRADGAGAVAAGRAFVTSPYVIAGFALYGLGAFVWLYVLARLPLSMAYPFVGIGFILTMIFGVLALGEQLNVARVLGTLLIAIGCVCVARSAA